MDKIIFSSGTSRGGTTFFARLLGLNEKVKVASDPFLPLFKYFHHSIMKERSHTHITPDSPLSDYYYSEAGIHHLDYIQEQNLRLPFLSQDLEDLRARLKARMSLAAKEVAPYAAEIDGRNYQEIFASGLQLLRKAYGLHQDAYCGFNDNWVSEFFPLLASSFTQAKFFLLVRDPRAVTASVLKLRTKNPKLAPFVYSLLRSWRKHVSFVAHAQTLPQFKDRLYVLRYEDFVSSPEESTQNICRFLNVEYCPEMLDTTKFRPIDGEQWKVYSHFENVPQEGIYRQGIDNWKKFLSPAIVELIEFVCGPEMVLFDYTPQSYCGGYLSPEAAATYLQDEREAQGWRLQHGDFQQEIGRELFRYQLLNMNSRDVPAMAIRQNFLFPEVYQGIQERKSRLADLLRR